MHATPSIEASTLTADPAVLVRMVVEQAAIIARGFEGSALKRINSSGSGVTHGL
jgi:hypothetical protein